MGKPQLVICFCEGRLGKATVLNARIHTTSEKDCSVKVVERLKELGVQKMQRCMELVSEEEKRRGAAFATVTFSRPDILMCSELAAASPGSLLAGQMVTWGEDWRLARTGERWPCPGTSAHRARLHIFTLDRQTAAHRGAAR